MSEAIYEADTLEVYETMRPLIDAASRLQLRGGGIQILIRGKEGKRSLEQNALKDIWYREIEKQGREMSTRDARRLCKLTIGVPILRGGKSKECERFRVFWDSAIKHKLSYEEKLAMMDYVPVTSLMTEAQMRSYLTTMQETFAGKGIRLTGLERGQEQYPEAAA
mgnify:CR=1